MEQPPGLAPEQFRALARLSALPALSEFYLAGGTAVAHHFRHRVSRDLDLFSASAASSLDAVQRQVTSMLRDAEVIAISDAALQLRVEGVPVDFVSYPHPLLEPTAPGPESPGCSISRP